MSAKCEVYSQVFASIKQIAFPESHLLVKNEKRTTLMQVTYDLSTILFHCALKGAWDSWGDGLFAFIIDPLGNCKLVHNGGSTKHKRLFWCTSEVAEEERKSFRRKRWGDWKETLWQPNVTSSKAVSGILERKRCDWQNGIKAYN